MGDYTLGNFYNTDSVIHRLDPRVKINLMFALMIITLVADGFPGLGLLFVFSLLGWILAKIPLRVVAGVVRPVIFFAVIPLVLNIFFVTDGVLLTSIGPITVTDRGIYLGVFYSCRLVLMFTTGILLTLTTSSLALAYAIGLMLAPFERFGLPAYEISLLLRIALRFVPDISLSLNHIRKAQLARGAVFDSGSIFARAKALISCMTPLFVLCFKNAENLSNAMESRCYHGSGNRSFYREYSLGKADWITLSAFSVLLVAIIVFRVIL